LTRKNTFYCRYGVFKVRVSRPLHRGAHEKTRPPATRPEHGLSKLNSVESGVEVDVLPGEPRTSDGDRLSRHCHRTSLDAYRGKSPGIP